MDKFDPLGLAEKNDPWQTKPGSSLRVNPQLQGALKEARQSDPRIDKMFSHLEASKYNHTIDTTDDRDAQVSVDDTGNLRQMLNVRNGVRAGSRSQIFNGPTPSKHEAGLIFSVAEVIVHEGYHSFLTDIGISVSHLKEPNPVLKGNNWEEVQAVAVQNITRHDEDPKAPLRKDHGGKPCAGYDYLVEHPDYGFVQKLDQRKETLKTTETAGAKCTER